MTYIKWLKWIIIATKMNVKCVWGICYLTLIDNYNDNLFAKANVLIDMLFNMLYLFIKYIRSQLIQNSEQILQLKIRSL